MSGIKRSGNRPKTAKHLRSASQKTHMNRTKEDRDREHALTDAWAERERAKEGDRVTNAVAASVVARKRQRELVTPDRDPAYD
jgi:hypothetical protein